MEPSQDMFGLTVESNTYLFHDERIIVDWEEPLIL